MSSLKGTVKIGDVSISLDLDLGPEGVAEVFRLLTQRPALMTAIPAVPQPKAEVVEAAEVVEVAGREEALPELPPPPSPFPGLSEEDEVALRKAGIESLEDLVQVQDFAELLKLCGLYRQRAMRIRAAAAQVGVVIPDPVSPIITLYRLSDIDDGLADTSKRMVEPELEKGVEEEPLRRLLKDGVIFRPEHVMR